MGRVFRADTTKLALDQTVSRLAAGQYGVFARAQVARMGATKGVIQHRLATERWERVALDVFRLAGSPPSWLQSLMAACLAWGEGAAASHRSAAALWRLAGFEPGPIEVTVPRDRRRNAPGIVHRNLVFPPDVAALEAIPVTTPARTLIDLASVAPREAVEEALDDALRRRIVSIPRLHWRLTELGGRGGRRGVGVMRSLLDARAGPSVPQSVFETRLLRALRRASVPEPAVQHEVRIGARLIAVVDFAFPAARLAIEADGYRWHSGRANWEHDRARGNELTLAGWRVVHVTWTDLSGRPRTVVDSIRRALHGSPPTR